MKNRHYQDDIYEQRGETQAGRPLWIVVRDDGDRPMVERLTGRYTLNDAERLARQYGAGWRATLAAFWWK